MQEKSEEILELKIKKFLSSKAFGVAGASNNHDKYGNKVVRCYLQHKKTVYPINPKESQIEGLTCLPNIDKLPDTVNSISVVTHPFITLKIVKTAINKGISNIWLQPGSENIDAIKLCNANNINLIYGGPCILVTLGYKDLN